MRFRVLHSYYFSTRHYQAHFTMCGKETLFMQERFSMCGTETSIRQIRFAMCGKETLHRFFPRKFTADQYAVYKWLGWMFAKKVPMAKAIGQNGYVVGIPITDMIQQIWQFVKPILTRHSPGDMIAQEVLKCRTQTVNTLLHFRRRPWRSSGERPRKNISRSVIWFTQS